MAKVDFSPIFIRPNSSPDVILISEKDETKSNEPEVFKMTDSNMARVIQSDPSDSTSTDAQPAADFYDNLEYYAELQEFLDVFDLFDELEQIYD